MNDRLFPKPEILCECGHAARLCVVHVGCYYLAYVCLKCGRGGNSARQSNGFATFEAMREALDGADFAQYLRFDKVDELSFRNTWVQIKLRIGTGAAWKHHPSFGEVA